MSAIVFSILRVVYIAQETLIFKIEFPGDCASRLADIYCRGVLPAQLRGRSRVYIPLFLGDACKRMRLAFGYRRVGDANELRFLFKF